MSLNKESDSNSLESNENTIDQNENACVVCFKFVDVYSIGECDHPVCYECSTRMRVLCRQNECPICRQDLQKVIFTTEVLPYRQLETNNRSGLYDKKYRICFSSLKIQKSFYILLDNPCSQCEVAPFHNFDALKDHVRREHELFYCDLCTENLKIFSFERRCYTRQELALHRRKGDPDNTSHRGHPLCKYCDCRYLDRDELFRHLRREHYYCHFCDADGANQFYADYISLRDHFRNEHHLCEDGDCAQEQFTAVFRSVMDLKAHQASTHCKLLGKAGTKQARTLEFEFTLAPRNRQNQNGEPPRGSIRLRNDPQMEFEIEDRSTIIQHPQKLIDHKSENEFPSLGGAGSSSTVTLMRPNVSIRAKAYGIGTSNLARTKENFPALGGENSALDPGPSLSGGQFNKNSASSILKNTSISTTTNSKQPGMVIHVSNRPKSIANPTPPKRSSEIINKSSLLNDFPALPNSHKTKYLDLAEPYDPPVQLSSVSAKHKTLLSDNFLSVTTNVGPKMSIVKTTDNQLSPAKKQAPINPPKLNSKDNFPELSAPINNSNSMTSMQPQWVPSKLRTEPKKTKVAAAPDFSDAKIQLNGPNKKNEENKKDKKSNNQIKLDTSSNIVLKANNNSKTTKSSKENNNNNKRTETNNNKSNNKNDRKLSEIQTDNLKKEDFPTLGTSATPPPGFENKKNKNPPPGFNTVTLNSVARPQNNLTFTTSLGESFNILPAHRYNPPPNATKRNQVLVTSFQQTLNTEVMNEFRRISQMFREGTYNTQPYYEHCRIALNEKFDEIFPELLALLPDINKQQELYLVHSQQLKETTRNKKNRSGLKTPKLEVCSTCKQVLVSNDLLAHLQSHSLESNFPVLNNHRQNSSILSSSKK